MHKIKITVIRKADYKNMKKKYENPSKVGKLTLKTIPYTGISSKWSKVKDATAYEIQLSTSKNFSTYNSYTTSTTKYDSKYLLAKKKYYVTQTNKEDKDKYGHPTIKPLFILENLVL